MITEKAKRVQTGFRLEERVLARVKEAARRRHISANEFVNETLKNATQDIESAEEREESRRKTEAFLSIVYGSWAGEETPQEILSSIKNSEGPRDIVEL